MFLIPISLIMDKSKLIMLFMQPTKLSTTTIHNTYISKHPKLLLLINYNLIIYNFLLMYNFKAFFFLL